MPWQTPTLKQVRKTNADYISGNLRAPLVPTGVARILADANAGNAHQVLKYIDWLADQLLPDRAEKLFLDRHGRIWLVNSDGTRGRKLAKFASGTANLFGTTSVVVPAYTQLVGFGAGGVTYETTAQITLGAGANSVPIRALDPGSAGNLPDGQPLSVSTAVQGLNPQGTIGSVSGGTDEESDDELRLRILARIQKPPMGGDADDYVEWALSVPGVTRAWCSPRELGPGTVTVRFMCDDLRAGAGGFPTSDDVTAVHDFLMIVRPVTADVFTVAPLPEPIGFTLTNLAGDSTALRAAIAANVSAMLQRKAAPASAVNGQPVDAQTIYAAWVSEAVLQTAGVTSFDLTMSDHVMPSKGSLAVLGTIA